MNNKIHFIVGMSRSGTEWLTKCLNNHSKVCAIGETAYFGRNTIINDEFSNEDLLLLQGKYSDVDLNDVTTNVAEDKGGMYIVIQQFINELIKRKVTISKGEFFKKLMMKFLIIEGKEIIIEKTPHHVNHLKEIRTFFPESKVIVSKRDAEGFMLSYKHQGDRKKEETKSIFEMIYHPFGCCMVYRKYNNSIENAMTYSNTFLVNFTRIGKEPENILNEIQAFLDLQREKVIIPKSNSSFLNNQKKELSPDDKFWLMLFGHLKKKSFTMRELIVLPFYVLYSLVKLPIWSFRVFNHYRKNLKGNLFNYFWNILRG